MIKYILSLWTSLLVISLLLTSEIHAKNSLFIEQNQYDSWSLTKNYNTIWLSSIDKNLPFTIKIKPYDYLLNVEVKFKNSENKNPNLELDIGNFTSELTLTDYHSYVVKLQPINSALFIEELKKQQTMTLIQNDQNSYSISLKGMQKALNDMEAFALDHYITLPQPFSAKLDTFATMTIPSIIPSNLYPVFRQQAALNKECQKINDPQNISCQTYQKLINILKENNICSKEEQMSSQSFGLSAIKSFQWINCSAG